MTDEKDLQFEDEISEEVLTRINTDDIKITEGNGCYEVEIDDETETYKTLVGLGKILKPEATEEEAFQAALEKVLNQNA